MLWLNMVSSKLKNDFRYSRNLVYNTFPLQSLNIRRKYKIIGLILNILDIMDKIEGTLEDLYGSLLAEKPKPMNSGLLQTHQELDEVIDKAYKTNGFKIIMID